MLAWTERSGLATDEEIAAGIMLPQAVIAEALGKLLNHSLVSDENGLLQVTAASKALLDMFDITEDIFEEYFPPDILHEAEQSLLYALIKDYRNQYYLNYLCTLQALKLWNWIHPAKQRKTRRRNRCIINNLIILLHDLLP